MVNLSKLKNFSPLYCYWQSDQNDFDEMNRLKIANKESPALYLFEKEPYKWEILFQSIIREIINGDKSSIKALQVLLNTISIEVRHEVLNNLLENHYINKDCYLELKNPLDMKSGTKKNLFRFLKILLAIFTNPYGIHMKRKKKTVFMRKLVFYLTI